MDDHELESFLLLLLADGNLPTGSFVASSGLESYVTHGYFIPSTSSSSSTANANQATIDFIKHSLRTYARSALPFVSDTHLLISNFSKSVTSDANADTGKPSEVEITKKLKELDFLYESMTLNEVSRRASKAQGAALLTLLTRGFSKPALSASGPVNTPVQKDSPLFDNLIASFKLSVRREEVHGHLPICWGLMTSILGLSLERSQHLHLFLQARSLLSSAVRLNRIGPYASQQLILHVVRDLVNDQLKISKDLRTGILGEDGDLRMNGATRVLCLDGPATTWPLGEILAARHDLQHSRIFNS